MKHELNALCVLRSAIVVCSRRNAQNMFSFGFLLPPTS